MNAVSLADMRYGYKILGQNVLSQFEDSYLVLGVCPSLWETTENNFHGTQCSHVLHKVTGGREYKLHFCT